MLSSGSLLIVRTDAIGDYVLFRNFIHYLKDQTLFKGYKFTLLGNISFKSLAEKYEKDVIDEFIWIDPHLLHNKDSLSKKNEVVHKIRLKKYKVILNPIHSRFPELDEFVASLGGKIIVGSKGDDVNFRDIDSYKKSSKIYNLLVDVLDTSFFEFHRNSSFVSLLTNSKQILPQIKINCSPAKKDKLTILLFPGASFAFRRWNPLNFSKLIIKLKSEIKESIEFIISGSVNDQSIANEILKSLPNQVGITDKTGKTNLVELADDIASVHLVISNETSAVHFAAATGTPTVCLSNGERFGRFSPYPASIAPNIQTIYPNDNFYKSENMKELNLKYKFASDLDIDTIQVNTVICNVKRILLKNYATFFTERNQ